MKRKHFILALVAMLWSFSFSAFADDVIVVNSWAELKAAIEAANTNSEVQRSAARQRSNALRTTATSSAGKTPIVTDKNGVSHYEEDFQTATPIMLGTNVVWDEPLYIADGAGITINLNGKSMVANKERAHGYPIRNYGKVLIKDGQGGGVIECGVLNGIKSNGLTNTEAVLVMTGGNIICNHEQPIENEAAIINYGSAIIIGGSIEGNPHAVWNKAEAPLLDIRVPALVSGDIKNESNGNVPDDLTGVLTVAQIGTVKYGSLQTAIDAAKDGDVVTLIKDVTEDVLITQKADLDLTIDGAGKTFTGVMKIFGNGRSQGAETLKIENFNFYAVDGSDACIKSETAINGQKSYAHNVTIEKCNFYGNDTYSYDNTFAVKYPSGGADGYGLTIKDCTVDSKMFGLLWVSKINKNLLVDNCTAIGVQEGITLTQTPAATIKNSTISAKGVVIRAGQANQPTDNIANEIVLENNKLTSESNVIVVRGDATDANLSMVKNAVIGTTHISGLTKDTKLSVDANYWEGDAHPTVSGADVKVNSYYSDEACTQLVRNQNGTINAFVMSDRIYGEVTTNAAKSLLINIYGKDGKIIGTTSVSEETKEQYLIGTPKKLTWRINLGADDSNSWDMTWNEGAPSIDNLPAMVKLVVDGAEVVEAEIKFTAGGDGKSPVFAAKADTNGKILSFIACEGKFNLNDANAVLAEVAAAAKSGDIITLIEKGAYTMPEFAGKELTIKALDRENTSITDYVNKGSQGMMGSTVHFVNLTINGATENYHGLFHTAKVTYTNCIINGLRFLYAGEVSFDGCAFKAEGVEHSFWTYGASNVTVKNSTFTYTDRAVNCYSEGGANHETDITFEGCSFKYAGTAAEPEGAVEINSSSVKSIDVDFNNGCTAPEKGAMWFISNWDSKKGDKTIVRIDDARNWVLHWKNLKPSVCPASVSCP